MISYLKQYYNDVKRKRTTAFKFQYKDKETNEAVQDVEYAHSQIEEHLGKNQIKVFTYPCGLTKEETRRELENAGFIQNLTDNKINKSKELNLYGLHRCYALEDNIWKYDKLSEKLNLNGINYILLEKSLEAYQMDEISLMLWTDYETIPNSMMNKAFLGTIKVYSWINE